MHGRGIRGSGTIAAALAVLGTGLVGATVPATASPPSHPVPPARSSGDARQAPASREVVGLATGDRVALSTWPDGHTGASLLPGSPSIGLPTRTFVLAGHPYVVPGTVGSGGADYLDLSLFDVDRVRRLARRSEDGSVPVEVTFRPGTRVAPVPGLRVDPASARRVAGGATVASARYLPHQVGALTRSGASGVLQRVALPGGDRHDPARQAARARARGYDLRTLTVKVSDAGGDPVSFADVVVMNVDNARLFLAGTFLDGGSISMSVPTGTYAVVSLAFGDRGIAVVQRPEFTVTDDRSVALHLADARARTGVTYPGARLRDTAFTLDREAERGGGLSYSVSGGPVRVQPSGDVRTGSLHSAVSGDLVRPAAGADTTIATIERMVGVPHDLTFAYRRDDFAAIDAGYASGEPTGASGLATFRFLPGQFFDVQSEFGLHRPSSRTELLLGNPQVRWAQLLDVYFDFRPFRFGEMSGPLFRTRPGARMHTVWLGGPVHPGPVVASSRRASRGASCAGCRVGDRMHFALASWTDTDPRHVGDGAPARTRHWSLSRSGRVVAHGVGELFTGTDVPTAPADYALSYDVAPRSDAWTHSTHTHTRWTFASAPTSADTALPLILADYRLPIDLSERTRAGAFGFRLRLAHLRGSGAAPVADVTARVRLGARGGWQDATVSRAGPGTWSVRFADLEPRGAGQWATLAVAARDGDANTVTERITRAFHVVAPEAAGSGRSLAPAAAPVPRPGPQGGARPACRKPPGHAVRCFALIGASGRAALDTRAEPRGFAPQDLRAAYGVDPGAGSGQTVAVVVAYDYPSAERDLNRYRHQFGLPPCTSADGCFTKVNQSGGSGDYPHPEHGWALEAALDLQMATSGCPRCDLVLVEANQASVGSVAHAAETAATLAPVVNNSYGLAEYNDVVHLARRYDQPGATMVASSGDFGYGLASFPASAPSVLAVGGTHLRRADNPRGWRERAWGGAGSGCSAYFDKPAWQVDTDCRNRTEADVSAVAAPGSGVAVYDSFGLFGDRGWFVLGGTSVSSPLVAAMLASTGTGSTFSAADAYAGPDGFHDVVRGRNGVCAHSYICSAKPGYDGPTGIGTPRDAAAFAARR